MDFSGVLSRIKPSAKEELAISRARDKVITALEQAAEDNNVSVVVVAGGSTAKGTFLKGDHDIDLFVRFKEGKNYSDVLELLLSDFASANHVIIERIHGSRDYFTFSFENYFFEVVPVKYITKASEMENVTDMSPLHVLWVAPLLSQQLKDDIRLAKQFCKSAQVYGAESFINGLSGHVLDILVIHYGGFLEFVEAVAKWTGVTVIDSNGDHKDVFKELNQSKLVSPLIVIDPVDKDRNAAAAVSQEKYFALVERAKGFVKSRAESYFEIPEFELKSLLEKKQNNEALFVVKLKPQVGKKDVVATRVLKVFEYIDRHLQLNDFSVRDANWFYGSDCFLYYFVDKTELDKTIIKQGPPISLVDDVKRFREVHSEAFEQDGRLFAPVKREFTNSYDCFNHLLNTPFVKERVASFSSKSY